MRTTLDIDDDVLRAAKEIARREKRSAGSVVSELARRALVTAAARVQESAPVYGVRPFSARGGVVTNEQIDRLREDDAY